MAWKEFSDLKPEDKKKEDERQKMIVCQSCLERATTIVIAQGVTTGISLNQIKEVASDLVDWVYEKAIGATPKKAETAVVKETAKIVDEKNLPVPTPGQSAILKKFKDKYNIEQTTVYSVYGRYPVNEKEAVECLTLIQKGK